MIAAGRCRQADRRRRPNRRNHADRDRRLHGAASDGTLLEAALVTGRRLGVGYALGLVGGLPLGFLCARFQFARDTIGVLALGLQTLPSVCWAPLSLLWFGRKRPDYPPGQLRRRRGRGARSADQCGAAWVRAAFQRRGVSVVGWAPSAIRCSTSFR